MGKYCGKCGTPMKDDDSFCPFCGTKFIPFYDFSDYKETSSLENSFLSEESGSPASSEYSSIDAELPIEEASFNEEPLPVEAPEQCTHEESVVEPEPEEEVLVEGEIEPQAEVFFEAAYEPQEEIPTETENEAEIIEAKESPLKPEKVKKSPKFLIFSLAGVLICAVIAVLGITLIAPYIKYNEALTLYESGKYEEAVTAFTELGGYKDSQEQIENAAAELEKEAKYSEAVALADAEKYSEAVAVFTELGDYKDCAEKIEIYKNKITELENEAKYNEAIALIDYGNIIKAYETLIALGGYKDSAEKANALYNQYEFEKSKAEKLKSAEIGDTVLFGNYEQDNDLSNGKEPIEWIVLDKDGSKLFVISKFMLDTILYNEAGVPITWETSFPRQWLNSEFLNTAFSAEEQNKIVLTEVENPDNPTYGTEGGNNTSDKVFFLSLQEVYKYMDYIKEADITEYLYAVKSTKTVWLYSWFLRSPGTTVYDYTDVSGNNSYINDFGVWRYGPAFDVYGNIRPVMWIDTAK